jgi:hypothetical protein
LLALVVLGTQAILVGLLHHKEATLHFLLLHQLVADMVITATLMVVLVVQVVVDVEQV